MQQLHVTEGRISMNKKITEAFAKGKAFIPFVTCGDPSLDVTEKSFMPWKKQVQI